MYGYINLLETLLAVCSAVLIIQKSVSCDWIYQLQTCLTFPNTSYATVLDMINAAYYDKPLWYLPWLHVWVYQGCFWLCIWHDKYRLLWQAFDIYQDCMLEFIMQPRIAFFTYASIDSSLTTNST